MKEQPPIIESADAAALERDARDLHDALSELVRVYQFRDRTRICCRDISVTQCHALDALVVAGESTLGRLADALYLDASTASRVVESLVRKGYCRRERDPDDGRAVRLVATPEGRALHAAIQRDLIDAEKRLIADIDPEVRQATARLVARLARAARERFSGDSAGPCARPTHGPRR
jgi:DNA-binding MarR family transcriptional regulator